jgi:hypothetical protein
MARSRDGRVPANSVVAAPGKPVLRTLIHFPALGQVYEIEPVAAGMVSSGAGSD